MSLAKEIESYMHAAGFWLKRQRKHNIWTNGECLIVTAKSPSCHRAVLNIKRDVDRYRKQRRTG